MVYSNKGQSPLIFIVILGFLVAGAIFLLTVIGTNHFLLGEVNNIVQTDDTFNEQARNVSQQTFERNNQGWDNAFVWLVSGLLLCMFLAGSTIQKSPVIVIVLFVLLIVTAYAGITVNSLYDELQADTIDTIDFADSFPKSNFIMENILLVIIGAVTLFGLGIFLSERIGL